MDFTAVFLSIKETVSKRLAGHSLDLTDALKTGLIRGLIAVVLTVLLFIGYTFIRGGSGIKPGHMPQCDSPFTRDLLTNVVNQSPAAQQGLKLLKVNEVSDFAAGSPGALADPSGLKKLLRLCLHQRWQGNSVFSADLGRCQER
jgi:hypothetical protein